MMDPNRIVWTFRFSERMALNAAVIPFHIPFPYYAISSNYWMNRDICSRLKFRLNAEHVYKSLTEN